MSQRRVSRTSLGAGLLAAVVAFLAAQSSAARIPIPEAGSNAGYAHHPADAGGGR